MKRALLGVVAAGAIVPSGAFAVDGAVTVLPGLELGTIVTAVAPLAVTAVLAIAGVKLSVSWFGAVINKFSGAGRRI